MSGLPEPLILGTMTEEPDRQQLLVQAGLKILGVAVAIGLAIGLGTWVMVKSLGLDEAETSTVGSTPVAPVTPLPTKALPLPGRSSPSPSTSGPSDYPTDLVTPSPSSGDLYLNASPVFVGPMERINLTGQWPGRDNVALLVQRLENGEWVDFGVQVNVQVGTFETYVMTGREGENKFRVFDPETSATSNEVAVTVG